MTKILVIEDETMIRESIVDTLEFAEYETAAASNGVEGVKLAKKFEPDLVLCDVMMPELDGHGVLLELSQLPKLSHVPFIFLTAKASHDDIRRGMSLGADDYLTKPFSATELLEAIKTRLDRHSQLQKYNLQQMEYVRQYINLTLPHELRTPLSGIMGYLYMLETGFEDMDAETIRDMLSKIKNSSNRLSHLVENYVAYSQIKLIQNDPELTEKIRNFSKLPDIMDLVSQIAETTAFEADRLNDLRIEIEPATVHIFYDHAKKLLSEIFSNAFKFSEKETLVEINARVEGSRYVISVSNHGRGMTQEQIDNINVNNQFERETYEQQGAGLGLVISKHIVEIYEGDLIIESEPDAITSVHIVLQLDS